MSDEKHPLNLPKGSVRALLTIATTVLTACLFFWGKQEIIAIWMPVYIIVVKSYFDDRKS